VLSYLSPLNQGRINGLLVSFKRDDVLAILPMHRLFEEAGEVHDQILVRLFGLLNSGLLFERMMYYIQRFAKVHKLFTTCVRCLRCRLCIN